MAEIEMHIMFEDLNPDVQEQLAGFMNTTVAELAEDEAPLITFNSEERDD
tara:strand:- start:386 stop:535 length:150 start_codon:yes stop_codon:yes gene_type:complete